MLTGKLWPAHLNILPNELLSSWLFRLSLANGLKLHIFAKQAFPGIEIWNRDIDKSASDSLITLLASHTGKTIIEIKGTTLQPYEGYLFERHISKSHSKWIMPLGIYHRIHRHYGLVFCPICLREDTVSYFRRHWRLAFSVVCEKHGVQLLDRCPKCQATIAFHRNDFKDRNYVTAASITECHNCGFDLINSPIKYEDNIILEKFIYSLQWILRNGYLIINKQVVYGHHYFDVLHQLFKLLTLDKYGLKLRNVIEDQINIKKDLIILDKIRNIEILPIKERNYTLSLLSWLMDEWPNRFITACKEAGLSKSRIEKDMNSIPYWFKLNTDQLIQKLYSPSCDEINAVINYLNKQGIDINKRLIIKTLGLSDSKLVNNNSTSYILNNMPSDL